MPKEQIQSVLNLERMSFERIEYSRNVNAGNIPKDYEMNFTRQVLASAEGQHFRVSLTANVWSKDEDGFKLEITLVGFFSCDCQDETLKRELLNKNAIAILFPYLRSQISLVTTQPDIQPITLQPMNIVAMFEEADNQKE